MNNAKAYEHPNSIFSVTYPPKVEAAKRKPLKDLPKNNSQIEPWNSIHHSPHQTAGQ
jgi:hypothetical protein